MPSASGIYQPRIRYLASSPRGDIVPDKVRLDSPLPLRLSDLNGVPQNGNTVGLTYGRYLEAIKDFLSRDSYRVLIEALEKQTGKNIALPDIDSITIRTEKHGALYHIASIDVTCTEAVHRFVATTALSETGKRHLENDFHWLQYLNNKHPFPFLPRAYHKGQTQYSTGQATNNTMLISLGEWLQDYHEFHLSIDSRDQRQKIIVWDADKGHRYLSDRQNHDLYRLASRILTLYYDTNTFQQISLWHHAAGDFIVRAATEAIDLKLVTVRTYEPMIGFSTKEGSNSLAGLLHFFLHLSIRMRIDRLDGTGDVAWADDPVLDAVMKGFYEALEIKEKTSPTPVAKKDFLAALKQFSRDDWTDMAHASLKTYPQAQADLPVIMRHLTGHCDRLHAVIQDFEPDSPARHTLDL